ncbi:hypothetical protein P7C70_g7355, partial [Phenoliferia sp. Uapishka_3]
MAAALSIIPTDSSSFPPPNSPEFSALKSTLSASSTTLISSFSSPSTWKTGKTFHGTSTLSAVSPPGSGDTQGLKWHARSSTHKVTGGWEAFRAGLMKDHSVHEQEYVEACTHARKVQVLEEGVAEVWQMSYKTPFPTSNRDFVFLLLTLDLTLPLSPSSPPQSGPRRFQIISIPVVHPDAPVRKGYVRGRYVAVEDVEEAENGEVLWRMATASSAEGSIPKSVADMAMPGTIAEDVPSFVKWLSKREKQ